MPARHSPTVAGIDIEGLVPSMGEVKQLGKVLRLDESFSRLADSIASRYGVTVQILVEALLLGCLDDTAEGATERQPEVEPMTKVTAREDRRRRRVWTGPRGDVISLAAVRARRGLPVPVTDAAELRARADSVCRIARAAREHARSICEKASHARGRAREVVERSLGRAAGWPVPQS